MQRMPVLGVGSVQTNAYVIIFRFSMEDQPGEIIVPIAWPASVVVLLRR